MDYKGMEEVDDGVYVYGGDEEVITNTASNVCVPCSADDEAMDEVSRSRLTSRAGWTDKEHAVGHVLVKGDGSTASQSAMEVEGESVNNAGEHMGVQEKIKRPRGNRGKNSSKKDANKRNNKKIH
jgi:hypothetical protein